MDEMVSIIMPSYNTADYIAESIDSVIAQTHSNWELIIVDDCSDDNTEDVVKRYLCDARIIFLKNKKNCGAAVSRNRALRHAKGKWIAFLDSDDLWHPRKLELQIKFMKKNGYHFSYTNYCQIDQDSKKTGIWVTGPKKVSRMGMYNYCWPGCLTVMYDKEYVGLIQISNIKKNNDYAMWLVVSKRANCYLLSKELAFYRRGREGSISTEGMITLIKWHYELWRKVENQNSVSSALLTLRNLCFGTIKKVFYVRRENK